MRTLWGTDVKLRQMMHNIADWWQKQEEATRELPAYIRQAIANFFRSGTRQVLPLPITRSFRSSH